MIKPLLPYYMLIVLVLMMITYMPFLSSYLAYVAGYPEAMGATAKEMLGLTP